MQHFVNTFGGKIFIPNCRLYADGQCVGEFLSREDAENVSKELFERGVAFRFRIEEIGAN